ncbi:cytochrome c3 family protein [Desulfogranum japonicum]|uniref:hypothetical protein n=1 Tax=Desulfogranum japonicum TaxID=231447 RepID=UPI00040333CC|nr:hypothetical protein [Desulfogranum japonicum]
MKYVLFTCCAFSLLFAHQPAPGAEYKILAWNDLGMHCYNSSFRDLAVLPPYNTLWAQVIRVGNPPQIVTGGITVTYSFPDNTYSVGKSDFWQYENKLFGVNLAANIGLTGKGLSGRMDLHGDHFVAEGIPLTEYRDSAPTIAYPYQIAQIVVRNSTTNAVLATLQTVAPVSSEMHCDRCHYDGGVENIATGRVETNILTLHDKENDDEYATPLMQQRPVLCAKCHASNALGTSGIAGLPNLSNAIHDAHKDKVPQTMDGCYFCHPGPNTKCLRGVMATRHGMDCIDCHGNMERVAKNTSPWLNEPRCDSAACHGTGYAQSAPLYRMSKGHGGIYCAGCHDSPHAIAPSRESNDSLKFITLQNRTGSLSNCLVCHASLPNRTGPHGVAPRGYPLSPGIYLPLLNKETP